MQNDERDNRELPPDEPSQQPPADEADEGHEADEFETASWPVQDATPQSDSADVAPEPASDAFADAESADADSDDVASAGMTPIESPEEPKQEPEYPGPEASGDVPRERYEDAQPPSDPPPPEVEAYAAPVAAASSALPAHSVPATEPGESTQCPRCGTENRPGIAFCRNCGQRLVAAGAPTTVARPAAPDGTVACPRCGTHNRAGVAFCQNCGANLQAAEPGYVPPPVAAGEPGLAASTEVAADEAAAGHAFLGPIVLLVGAIGIATAWMLPFALGTGSLYERSFGDPSGYGISFWTAYDGISDLASQAYFGFAAPAPILVALLVALAIGGMARARPATLQMIGLLVALLWSLGLLILFVVVEVFGGSSGDLVEVLRALTPAGIIFALASLIVLIGVLTRFGRG